MKRRIFLFSLPILLLAWFFVFGATARAAEIVIAADTVWTKAQSPIVADGDISIAAGVKLTVEPGAVIKLSPNNSFAVMGELAV